MNHQYLSPDDGMMTDTDVETTRSETPNIIRLPMQMMEPALMFRGSPDPHHHQQQHHRAQRRNGNTSNTNSSWLENPDRDSRDSRSSMGLNSDPGVQLDDLRNHRTSKQVSKQSQPTPPLQSPITITSGILQSVGDEESRPGSRGSHESEWNSTHPCFPHRNPYVPIGSSLYESTRVIRIARDFMVYGDLAPAYSNVFPDILEPHVTEDQFRVVIARVNEQLQIAFDPWNMWNWIDAIVGLLTLWLVEELVSTHCKRVLRRVEVYLEERNRELEESGQKAVFVPLRRTGYMNVGGVIRVSPPLLVLTIVVGYTNSGSYPCS